MNTDTAPAPGNQHFTGGGDGKKETPTPSPTPDECKDSIGKMEVFSPNGGEKFLTGDEVNIKWCLNDYSAYNQSLSSIWLVSRQTQINGTFVYQNQNQIASNVLMAKGINSLSWKIPNSTSNAGSYVILVNATPYYPNYDYSNNVFSINTSVPVDNMTPACSASTGRVQVLTPNGGESYNLNKTITIKWCLNDYNQYNQYYASIWLSRQIAPNTYSNQLKITGDLYMVKGENSYDWKIPGSVGAGGSYSILVNINSLNPNYDRSDSVFSIVP